MLNQLGLRKRTREKRHLRPGCWKKAIRQTDRRKRDHINTTVKQKMMAGEYSMVQADKNSPVHCPIFDCLTRISKARDMRAHVRSCHKAPVKLSDEGVREFLNNFLPDLNKLPICLYPTKALEGECDLCNKRHECVKVKNEEKFNGKAVKPASIAKHIRREIEKE